jgi:pantetheine-phosphate adenylyltransferase
VIDVITGMNTMDEKDNEPFINLTEKTESEEILLTKQNIFGTKLNNPGERVHCVDMIKKAVYPGSFDPITNGHVDIIQRGLEIFDKILIAVLENPKKRSLFSTKERVTMIQEIFAENENIEVKSFHGLLVDFANTNESKMIIRGMRAISDFEYEFQMALMNRKLDPDIETLFMMPSLNYSFLSSRLVKEVSMLGGCLEGLVPGEVEDKLRDKYKTAPKTNST